MDARRAIPAVERLLSSAEFAPLLRASPRPLVVDALQRVQSEVRSQLSSNTMPQSEPSADAGWYAARVAAVLETVERASLHAVINATGVILHTNLGRAPLADAAIAAMMRIATSYSNLEYDLDAGARGSRYVHCAALLRELTGAEDALVVNNNAAALVLALNTHALGGDAVISRGELVEIGGSFRVPEIMARSGARMAEVGATNRVYLADYYEAAVRAETRAILKVHPSNFRITGFASDVGLKELSQLAAARAIPLIADLGSGLMLDAATLGLPHEPTGLEALRAGADIVTMSGDKLLGGPQAGIVLGRKCFLDAMRKNPLCRALRVDKLTLAALEATLALYRDPARALREVPVLAMLTAPPALLRARAHAFSERLRVAGIPAECMDGSSAVGGGAYPEVDLPTTLVLLTHASPNRVDAALRAGMTPVVARIVSDRVAVDLRTVRPDEEDALFAEIARVCP